MSAGLKKCAACGRLFSGAADITECSSCLGVEQEVYSRIEEAVVTQGLTSVSEIAQALDVDPRHVRKVLRDLPGFGETVESDELCASCGQRPRKHGLNFCTVCLVDISADLRDTAGMVNRQMEARDRRPEARFNEVSVSDALREKQRRTGHHRFNPVPKNVKRGT